MLARGVMLAVLLCCACGKWVYVEDKKVTLKPKLGDVEPGSRQLVATANLQTDGNVEISARIETQQCTVMSTPRTQDVKVERYEVPKKNTHVVLIALGATYSVIGVGLFSLGTFVPEKDESDINSSGLTANGKLAFKLVGAGVATAGLAMFLPGLSTQIKKNKTRQIVKTTDDGQPARIAATCPASGKLDQLAVVTPWGDQLSTRLKNGKGTLAIDWSALVNRNRARGGEGGGKDIDLDGEESRPTPPPMSTDVLSGKWKLTGGSPPIQTDWIPSPGELVSFRRAYDAAVANIVAADRAKNEADRKAQDEQARLAKIEKRKQTGPPGFTITSTTSEYEVVPAGIPTVITIKFKNVGPGPGDGGQVVFRASDGQKIVQTSKATYANEVALALPPLAANDADDRRFTLLLPANHPGGELKIIASFKDEGAAKPIDLAFTLPVIKQLPGAPKLVVEKFEPKGALRAGMRGELRVAVKNEGTAHAYGTVLSMTSPKSATLDALKHRIPYLKAGATLDVAIPLEFPRDIEDANPRGLINVAVVNGTARCAGAIADCYAKLTIGPAPVPKIWPTCDIVEGATTKNKQVIANAGAALVVRCKLQNDGEETAKLTIKTGIDQPSTKQPGAEVAPGQSTTITLQVAVPRDAVAASDHVVVINMTAPHMTEIEPRLAFRVGKAALCAPNSLDRAEYKRKTGELKKSKDEGIISEQEFDQLDKELLGCLKK